MTDETLSRLTKAPPRLPQPDKPMPDELLELREGLRQRLDEYTGFPPDIVLRWVDYDLAITEILSYLAEKGVAIKTTRGLMLLADLMKLEI